MRSAATAACRCCKNHGRHKSSRRITSIHNPNHTSQSILVTYQQTTPSFTITAERNHSCRYYSNNISKTIIPWTQVNRSFSTQAQTHESETTETKPPPSKKPPTLRRIAQPFLLTYHPDKHGTTSTSTSTSNAKSTTVARTVNLHAIQTLNGMIDTVESIHIRAIDPATSAGKGTITSNLQPTYVIEFAVPSNTHTHDLSKPKESVVTRRSVDLTFPAELTRAVEMVDERTGKYSVAAARALRNRCVVEIGKLLLAAGLTPPPEYDAALEEEGGRGEEGYDGIEEYLLQDELGIDGEYGDTGRQRFRGRAGGREETPYEASRRRFVQKMDWKRHRELYEMALDDAKRDMATQGLISMSAERRGSLVASVISRIRVFDPTLDRMANLTDDTTTDSTASHPSSSQSSSNLQQNGLDGIQQLIAIRRLSLLLSDNFDHLEMEDMGRIWENLIFVLTPERNHGAHNPENIPPGGIPFSRRRRLRNGRESGFKFSFHDDARLTVYVPVDFLDEEFLGEMRRHLGDFYDLVCVDAIDRELESFFPPYYKDL